MTPLWYILLGVFIGLALTLPVTRLLLRRGEQRARDAERRASEAERLAELGSMTSGLAHEIKNPLSTVGLNAQLLAEGLDESDLPEDQKSRLTRRVGALRREVDRLRGILTDFLQFAGRMVLDPEPHDLVKLVDELSDFYHPQCERAGVVLRTQLPPEPVIVPLDERMFKQAVLNLMINATQAMEPAAGNGDPAELILRVEADPAEARLHVTDTGPGIDPDKVSRIFHPFVSQRAGGTGLGLPTTRRIIVEHGGSLDVHSEVGRGSDFVVRLPRRG